MAGKWRGLIDEFLVGCDDVSELVANGGSGVFGKRSGLRFEIPNVFSSREEYVEETRGLAGLVCPGEDPVFLVEGRLDLGDAGSARCHIVFPPACDVPMVTIAKKSTTFTCLEDIYRGGSMSLKIYNFLQAAVDCRLTIVFSGSTGAGKTTFLEALSRLFPMDARIGVVEDAPELRLVQSNVIYLHSRPWKPGMSPNDEVTIDWCTRQMNRARVDTLIIGETRGAEFAQFLTAANSGMEGSLTTIHANSPRMCLQKMTDFVIQATSQPTRVVNKSISSTVDLIVQLSRFPNGDYRVAAVEEVSRIVGKDESAEVATTTLSRFDVDAGVWSDSFLISDHLRARFEAKGYNCASFTKDAGRLAGFGVRRGFGR